MPDAADLGQNATPACDHDWWPCVHFFPDGTVGLVSVCSHCDARKAADQPEQAA